MDIDSGSAPLIKIENLSKRYSGSDKLALDNLNLDIKAGEVYGFLGPNGAGKSTAIKLILNFLHPTKGFITVNGFDSSRQDVRVKESIGYLAGDVSMYPKMTGRQLLRYLDSLQPGDSLESAKLIAKKLGADLDKKLGQLSRGNRQKIGIIQAFMHNPKVIILDEPTSGLDPLMQEVFQELVLRAKQNGACIFMSSHVLSEVQKMCDRVGIIREGKLVSEQSISDLNLNSVNTFTISFAKKVPIKELRSLKGVNIKSSTDKNVELHMSGDLSPLFSILSVNHVEKIDTKTLDLEEMFIHFYSNDKQGDQA